MRGWAVAFLLVQFATAAIAEDRRTITVDARQPRAAAPTVPEAEKIVVLIRTTLLTLNDAIATGNFTVMRDRAGPSVRQTAGAMYTTYAQYVALGLNLSGVAIMAPQITEAPSVDAKGNLNLKGQFISDGVTVEFALSYEQVKDKWLWNGIGLKVIPSKPSAEAVPAAPGSPSAKSETSPGKAVHGK